MKDFNSIWVYNFNTWICQGMRANANKSYYIAQFSVKQKQININHYQFISSSEIKLFTRSQRRIKNPVRHLR